MTLTPYRYKIIGGMAVVFLVVLSANSILTKRQEAALAQMTDFERGLYYFNQDGDPLGPYDLKAARAAFSKDIARGAEAEQLSWYHLGRIDFLEGNISDAIYKFEKQKELYADELLPNVHYMLGLTYGLQARGSDQSEDWEKALASFVSYLQFFPDSPWARTDIAWLYFSQGRFEEMKPILEEGLSLHPEHPWLNNMYGLALLNTGEPEEALVAFERAQVQASELTATEWGSAYPGNDARSWESGLASFRSSISKNIELTQRAINGNSQSAEDLYE